MIDTALEQGPTNFEAFLAALDGLAIEAARRGQALWFRCRTDGVLPAQKSFTRCDTLKDEYTKQAIRERITGGRSPAPAYLLPRG